MTIHEMQNMNRATIEYASTVIVPGMTLVELRSLCEEYMLSHGADSFWYWDVGAFVFSGDKTAVSVSGREYKTDDHIIEPNDIITIDLSPQSNCIWGDYARTLIVENGRIVKDVEQIQNDEWRNGLKMEAYLHEAMLSFVNENTTFEELFYYINDQIKARGYINLDFLGNLGHSIVVSTLKKETRKNCPLSKRLLLNRISACLGLYTDSKRKTYTGSTVVFCPNYKASHNSICVHGR